MSRIGLKPIILNANIKLNIEGTTVSVEGSEGKLVLNIPNGITFTVKDNIVNILKKDEDVESSILGLGRSLIQNAVTGVSKKWNKTLELVGVGYRAQTNGTDLELNIGFSHPIKLMAPKDISFKVEENKIIVTGIDKYMVGEMAATIKRLKPPEPYKGKGIRYSGEFIRKKLGKAAKAVGGAGAK